MKIRLVVLLTAIVLSGCATTNANWSATGGSRADATVRISYQHGGNVLPPTSEVEAHNLAIARCKTWGYTGAEAFGGTTSQCNQPNRGIFGGSCDSWLVTKEYQCTGTGTGSLESPGN